MNGILYMIERVADRIWYAAKMTRLNRIHGSRAKQSAIWQSVYGGKRV